MTAFCAFRPSTEALIAQLKSRRGRFQHIMDEKGYLRVIDRIKDVINRGGYKIYASEVENVLLEHPAIVEVAVVAKPCPVLGERVDAFVLLRNVVEEAELQRHCGDLLSDYKAPEMFHPEF
jgi:O-succinylbenzoic acid--CoA ligase